MISSVWMSISQLFFCAYATLSKGLPLLILQTPQNPGFPQKIPVLRLVFLYVLLSCVFKFALVCPVNFGAVFALNMEAFSFRRVMALREERCGAKLHKTQDTLKA